MATAAQANPKKVVATVPTDDRSKGGATALGPYRSRLDQLIARRLRVEDIWRKCFDVTQPFRGAGIAIKDAGTDPDASIGYALAKLSELYDTTGVQSVRILAAALQNGLTPSNTIWALLELVNRTEDNVTQEEKEWLEDVSRFLWRNIHNDTFDADSFEAMLDIVMAGIASLYIEEDVEHGGFSFEAWPLAECYFASTRKDGLVDVCYRVYFPTASALLSEFGDKVSETTRKLAETDPERRIKCCRAIEPRQIHAVGIALPKARPVASITFEYESQAILSEHGYYEFPLVVGRWTRIPGSVYATSVTLDALPAIRSANKVKEFTFDNADVSIAGMWIGVDDGVLNPRTIEIGPRKVVIANSPDSFKRLEAAGDFDISAVMLEGEQKSIRQTMLTDHLEPQDKADMTAYEVHVRVDMIRQLLGPIYGRMMVEWVAKIVERCYAIANRAGALPPPPESLLGEDLRVKFVSPIARAQRGVEVQAMTSYESDLINTAAGTGKAEILDVYKWDESKRRKAELMGVPLDLLNDEDDVDGIRNDRAEAAQQQQQQAAAAAMMPKAVDKITGAIAK